MSQQPPPDRRDQLLSDLHEDPASLSLPAQMAARIRRRRRIRTAGTSLAILTIASVLLFLFSQPDSTRAQSQFVSSHPALPPTPASTSPVAPAAAAKLPAANIATDADLMAALEHESVMIFTLADGQRQVVWLDGRPRG